MPESWKSETQLRNHGRHRSLEEASCYFPTSIQNMIRSNGNPLPQAHAQANWRWRELGGSQVGGLLCNDPE